MSATGIILLILFAIGLCLSLYYAVICMQIRPKKHKQYKSGDLGPLLGVDPDSNGHNDLELPVDTVRSIDEPDKSTHDDSLDEISEKDLKNPLLQNISYQTTPQCASKDPKADAVFLPIEDEPSSTNTSKPVLMPLRRDLKPTFMAVNSAESSVRPKNPSPPQHLIRPDSYDEDGLLVPRSLSLVEAAVLPAALLLEERLMRDHRDHVENKSPVKLNTKKQVQFSTTPEDGTPIDEMTEEDPKTRSVVEKSVSDQEKPVFRLHNTTKEYVTEGRIKSVEETTYRTNQARQSSTIVVSNQEESVSQNIIMNPIYERMTKIQNPIGWVAPRPPKHEPHEEEENDLNKKTNSTNEDLVACNKSTSVVVILPSEEQPITAEDGAPDISDTDTDSSSDPEITEYSFQTGPMVPSTAAVLADEMGSYSDPKVTSFVTLPDGNKLNNDRPPTPSTEGRSSSSDSSIDDQTLGACDENNYPSEDILGTPPNTPPCEDMSSDFIIVNPAAGYSSESSPENRECRPNNRARSGSSSSSMSSSSTSSSSTNGSYRIQHNDKIENSNEKVVNVKNVSKIPKLK